MMGIATAVAITLVTTVGCGASTGSNHTSNQASGSTSSTAKVQLTETGSSLLYPLFNSQWIAAYQRQNSHVSLQAASTGSGQGISDATQGLVNIGASDAYMADGQVQQTPGMLNIPLAISAQQMMYNVPGISKTQHLKLTGAVIAKIYEGQVKYWDDSTIASLNTGIKLPHKAIVPVRRSDGSGDTFLFTQFLSDTSSSWNAKVKYGTTVSWPSVIGEIGSQGNQGVEQSLKSTPYSIGYVGISWLDQAVKDGLGYAALQNKSGNFVLPTQSNIQAAAKATTNVPAGERISLIDAAGKNSYPIINFEYAIVKTRQSDSATATALKQFLDWAISPAGGNDSKYLSPVHFLPLPSNIAPLSKAQINKIH